ncbi:MAG: efflux RND transporter periplasmic adaptor subunit, partial [Alphaproteobacteria bacterium]
RDLVAAGTAAKARADQQERTTLQVKRVVAELSNALGLLPTRLARLEAQIARTEAALKRARRDLDKTRIVSPFEVRVGEVSVEMHQFVGVGQPLISAHGIARAEITAQLPMSDFPRLIGAALSQESLGVNDLTQALDLISAEVRLVFDRNQQWSGEVVRVENAVDPQGRTVPVVVVVEGPYAAANPPKTLPLVPNMYVEITLVGPAAGDVVSLPDSAVHQGDTVYVRTAAGRLELREVTVAYRQDGRTILAEGIAPGEEIILDDLIPAMPGLLVDPVEAVR